MVSSTNEFKQACFDTTALSEFPEMPYAVRLLQGSKLLLQIPAALLGLLLYTLQQLCWGNGCVTKRVRANGDDPFFGRQCFQRLIGVGPCQGRTFADLVAR